MKRQETLWSEALMALFMIAKIGGYYSLGTTTPAMLKDGMTYMNEDLRKMSSSLKQETLIWHVTEAGKIGAK
jgi:hypothetical protein